MNDVYQVALDVAHTCAIKLDGSLWCWGLNGVGEVGDGTFEMRKTPKRIFAGGITQVAAGGQHTCAITQNKILWCWGDDGEGQVGDGKF